MLFIGIDSGTQSTKTIVLDSETGQIVAHASQAYGLIEGLPPGHLEQHPQSWVDAARHCLLDCVSQLGERRAEIRGIGVSGQQHGLVALDENDAPVRPAKLWCDTSTTAQCAAFSEAFGGVAGLTELAGNAILPGYTAPKILWLKQNEPDNFVKTKSVLLPHDYLNFWLTGVKRMEYGDASGTGLLDIRARQWSQPLMTFVDDRLSDMLPPLGSSREPHGMLRPELADELGLPKDVLVSAGGGDNMMGAIGTGNIREGVVTASLGTSGTLYGAASAPMIDAQGEVAAFCDSTDQWFPLVCTMNVTVVTEAVRKLFGWNIRALEEAVLSAPIGAGGLLFLPYLHGERTPNLPNGSGVLHGMRPDNMTPAHLARAAVEGATLGLAYGLQRFRELGMDPKEIHLTGGGSRSAAWRQIVADSFNAEVVCLSTAEGAGLGAAIQAVYTWLKAQGNEESYDSLCARFAQLDESTRHVPNGDNAAFYQAQLERQLYLTRSLHKADCL